MKKEKYYCWEKYKGQVSVVTLNAIYEPRRRKPYLRTCAPNDDSEQHFETRRMQGCGQQIMNTDQNARMRMLI